MCVSSQAIALGAMMRVVLTLSLLLLAPPLMAADEITRIWLTHKSNDPSKIVVNWMTDQPGDSIVRFGTSPEQQQEVRQDESVTLHNERNANTRSQAQKQWHEWFRRGTCCITGFGYYAERAEVDGFPYYNTSLSGKGTQYPDPHSKFIASEDSYLLLTVNRGGPMFVDIKSLKGDVLDRREFKPATRSK